ncbi:MAG: divalent-cation tolerance protein CutA [Candidatus Altiarchaeota archaeon]
MGDYYLIHTTVSGRDEAVRISDILVKGGFVACVNYFPVYSTYVWDGRLEHSEEYLLLCKTTRQRIDAAFSRILEEHSYECPEIISVEISHGHPSYLDWISYSTKNKE